MEFHHEQFEKFITVVEKYDYFIIRGFRLLPKLPDTDIDLIVHPEQYKDFCNIAQKYLKPGKLFNYGYSEWCDMQYQSYWTIASKGQIFKIDLYNSLYFRTPFKNKFWTVNKKYFDKVLKRRRKENFYYLVSLRDDLALTICRAVLDMNGNWKDKYKNRVQELLKIISKKTAIDTIAEVLPHSEWIYECLQNKNYEDIKWD